MTSGPAVPATTLRCASSAIGLSGSCIVTTKPAQLYDEDIAWAHHTQQDQQNVA
jgi:hypothetical protein